jgi:hypothetical protein
VSICFLLASLSLILSTVNPTATFRDLGADWAVLFDGTGLSARWDWEDRMGSPRPESGGSAVQWRRKKGP